MKRILSGWLAAISLSLMSVSMPAQAQLAEGVDFQTIKPALLADNPAKIEVIEFFSYACPHCNDLNPFVAEWSAKLPADVDFKHVPVSFNSPFYQLMAKLYYALEAIDALPMLSNAAFDAIHNQGVKLIDDKSILEWVTSKGVDAKKFSDAYRSFGVASKVKRADQLAQSAKIRGVPAMIVDGRYLVVGQNFKSYADLLTLTDKVIAKARLERNGKKQ